MSNHLSGGTSKEKVSSFSLFKGCWWLLITILILGMTYLRLQSQVMSSCWRVKELEKKLSQLRDPIFRLEAELSQLQTPAAIKARLEAKGIWMDVPLQRDVVRISQAPKYDPTTTRHRLRPKDVVLLSVTH